MCDASVKEKNQSIKKGRNMEQEQERTLLAETVMVVMGVVVMGVYHFWLLFTICRSPSRTCIGINAHSRRLWVHAIMSDPLKNGTLAVQTIRNNIMASTLLATTAITLSSLISVYVSSKSISSENKAPPKLLLEHNTASSTNPSFKYFSILLCFLVAFVCNVQSIRYYAHVSFLVTLPASKDQKDAIEYVARNLNRGSFFWSLGLRFFYLSIPLFLWIFGAAPMLVCSCILSSALYFLDTTTGFTRNLHNNSFRDELNEDDIEAACQPRCQRNGVIDESQLHCPLLQDHDHPAVLPSVVSI